MHLLLFEKFTLQPILTRARQIIENFYCRLSGRRGNGSSRLLFRSAAPQAPRVAPIQTKLASEMSLFIGETSWLCEPRLMLEPCSTLGTSGTKKKGGAINAPPLEGSDTSVSSPKRQTAEAVRNEDLLDVTVSQEPSYIPVIVPWNLMAVLRCQQTLVGVENHAPPFADATKYQSI